MTTHVQGHFRHVDGKLIWVAEHEREGAPGHKIHSLFDEWEKPHEPKLVQNEQPETHEPQKPKHDTAGLEAGTDLGSGVDAPESKDDLTKEHYQDVGVKIGGAAKDKAALKAKYYKTSIAVSLDDLEMLEEVSPELAHELVTKEQQLGTKTAFLEQLKNQGATPGCAYIAGRLYTAIGDPVDTPAGRKAFALGIKRVENAVAQWKTIEDATKGMVVLSDEVKGFWLPAEDEAKRQELSDVRAAALKKRNAAFAYGTTATNAEREAALAEYKAASDAYLAFYKQAQKSAETNPDNTMMPLRSLGQNFEKMMKTESRLKDAVKKGLEIEKTVGWEFMGKKVAEAGAEAKQKVVKPWHGWVKPESDTYEKEGGVAAKIYVAKSLKNEFGIAGIEYGNWMSKDASEHHTQACGEALADFAHVMGLDPMDVSLKGRLKLAFGARGKGKAKAHYEPNTKAINLTKMAGGGSLAHEWGHAMDNIMAMVSTGGKSHQMAMMTGNNGVPPGDELPSEVTDAFKAVHEAIHGGDFQAYIEKTFHPEGSSFLNVTGKKMLSEAGGDPSKALEAYEGTLSFYKKYKPLIYKKKLHNAAQAFANEAQKPCVLRTPHGEKSSHFAATGNYMGEYWGRKEELFARAFESYVMDKMKAAGMKNTYLVSGVAKEHAEAYGKILQVLEPIGGKTSIYPLGEEREKINAAMDKLVASLRSNSMFQKAFDMLSKTSLFE